MGLEIFMQKREISGLGTYYRMALAAPGVAGEVGELGKGYRESGGERKISQLFQNPPPPKKEKSKSLFFFFLPFPGDYLSPKPRSQNCFIKKFHLGK